MKSTMFSLNLRDWLKGLVMAVLVPAVLIIQQSIAAGSMTFNWKQIGFAAISGLVAYLIKNFLTDGVAAAKNTLDEARKKDE